MTNRSRQLAIREARRKRAATLRQKQRQRRTISSQGIKRERTFVRYEQERKKLIAQEKEIVDKLVKDINAGKISNINQIPEKYRSTIGVTQSDLNKIQNYYAAKKKADLWSQAFRLADRVLSSSDSRAIFAIAWSDNPYAKEAYKLAKYQREAYRERKTLIEDIRKGKITGVAVAGGRIFDTKRGIPITPARITRKQLIELVKGDLQRGEKLIYNPTTYVIKGIRSNTLQQTFPYTKKGMEYYSQEINRTINLRQKVLEKSSTKQSKSPPTNLLEKLIDNLEKQNLSAIQQRIMINKLNSELKKLTKEAKNIRKTKKSDRTSEQNKRLKKINDLIISAQISKSKTGQKKLLTAGIYGGILELGAGFVQLIDVAKKNPISLPKVIGVGLWEGLKSDVKILLNEPDVGIVKLGTQAWIFKGIGKGAKVTGRALTNAITQLDPRFLGKLKTGTKIEVPVKGKKIKLKVVGSIPRETLENQLKRVGKKVTAISSQADSLVGMLRNRKRVIRKPLGKTPGGIPIEKLLSKRGKLLLKKFDQGVILNKKQILELDLEVRTLGSKGLLERSFFADPSGKIRPSRLGVLDKLEASVIDYFRGDITFRKPKPQILIFDDIKIQNFPKTKIFNSIKRKIRLRKALTKLEADTLLLWQLKKSGKFKPLGFLSQESELTLAPGEVIKKVKVVGVTLVNGKRVPIVQVKVVKLKGKLRTFLNDFNKGKLTKTQIRQLDRLLTKETGFNYGLSYRRFGKKYVSIRRIGLNNVLTGSRALVRRKRTLSKRKTSNKKISKKTSRVSRRKTSKRVSRRVSKTSVRKVSRKTSGRTSRKVGSKTKRKVYGKSSPKRYPRIIRGGGSKYRGSGSSKIKRKRQTKKVKIVLSKDFKKKKLRKPTQGYYVVIKRRGKLIRLNPRPLRLNDARDYLAYKIDKGLGRTAYFEPIGKSKEVVVPPRSIQGYFSKVRKKLRPYKIRVGRKKLLRNGYIERRKYIADTKSEVRALQKARRRVKKRVVKRKPVRRKIRKRKPIRRKKTKKIRSRKNK